jgi:hypothetical protein
MFRNWKDQVNNQLNTFTVFIFSAVIDIIYVSLVVLFNVAVDWFVGVIKPVGLTYWSFFITQILLGLLSLYNVGIYVYSDMRIMYFRSRKMIATAQKKIEKEKL